MVSLERGDEAMAKTLLLIFAARMLCLPALAEMPSEAPDTAWAISESVVLDEEAPATPESLKSARQDFIDRIIEQGKELYDKADGKAQRAH